MSFYISYVGYRSRSSGSVHLTASSMLPWLSKIHTMDCRDGQVHDTKSELKGCNRKLIKFWQLKTFQILVAATYIKFRLFTANCIRFNKYILEHLIILIKTQLLFQIKCSTSSKIYFIVFFRNYFTSLF